MFDSQILQVQEFTINSIVKFSHFQNAGLFLAPNHHEHAFSLLYPQATTAEL
jgi:hypothetical protein